MCRRIERRSTAHDPLDGEHAPARGRVEEATHVRSDDLLALVGVVHPVLQVGVGAEVQLRDAVELRRPVGQRLDDDVLHVPPDARMVHARQRCVLLAPMPRELVVVDRRHPSHERHPLHTGRRSAVGPVALVVPLHTLVDRVRRERVADDRERAGCVRRVLRPHHRDRGNFVRLLGGRVGIRRVERRAVYAGSRRPRGVVGRRLQGRDDLAHDGHVTCSTERVTMGRLDGKVALITGAARGQGEAEARLFVREGARVVLADVLDDDGARVARDIGDDARYEHLDVGDETEWTTVVDATTRAFGSLDVLVNNAGILRHHVIEDHPLDEYLDVIRVNQVGCFLGMRAAVPAMRASGGGSIVNTASVAGLVGNAGLVAYTASKFAVRGMTKVAAVELGRYGIRVNSIHPGGVDTAMVRTGVFGDRDPSTAYSYLPLGRIGTVDEVAAMALFLASDESSFSTGSEFVLDGGSTAGAPGRRG